jgi:TonB-dependent SusC/RagA subfamily outer membrane receptor
MKTEKEKISIGYGEVDRESLTYAVDKIDAEQDLSISGYSNIYDYMRGKLPGVRVTNDNKIMIRGISSLSISSDPYALNLSSDPLFVVNGAIVNNIDFINVNEIKNISVLKDASASIYGSRGTNGVILINLKR